MIWIPDFDLPRTDELYKDFAYNPYRAVYHLGTKIDLVHNGFPKKTPKMCFNNSIEMVCHNPLYEYYEGLVNMSFFWMMHGWNKFRDKYLDHTLNILGREGELEYRGLHIPRNLIIKVGTSKYFEHSYGVIDTIKFLDDTDKIEALEMLRDANEF